MTTAIIVGIICLVVGAVIGILFSKSSLNTKAKFIVDDAKKNAENLIEKANVQAESIKKEKNLQAKEKFLELKSQHDADIQSREKKMQEIEKRIKDKEHKLNDELSKTGKLEKDLDKQIADYAKKNEILERKQQELDVATAKKVEILEKIANYTAEEAKAELVETMKAEAKTRARHTFRGSWKKHSLMLKTKQEKSLSRPSRESEQNKLSKTQYLFSILNLMR
ncbi:Ribonuclease Y [Chryseobacterium oranimense G311]|nr:Ribonuclease Y [Chryseobacterium oranimense G311]